MTLPLIEQRVLTKEEIQPLLLELPPENATVAFLLIGRFGLGNLTELVGRSSALKPLLHLAYGIEHEHVPLNRVISRASGAAVGTVTNSFEGDFDWQNLFSQSSYPQNTTRESRMSLQQFQEFFDWIDKHLPVKSGQLFRMQKGTKLAIHQKYKKEHPDVRLVISFSNNWFLHL